MSNFERILCGAAVWAALAALPLGASAQDDCEIVLGAAISLTGNYATNGIHAKNGYDIAVDADQRQRRRQGRRQDLQDPHYLL